jgi:hypothetical protein
MALVLEILLGVAILASFLIAYMSARTWPIYQAVLVVFVFLGAVAFFYLAARTLATHNAWRTVVNRATAELDRLESQSKVLRDGGPPDEQGLANPKGIKQLHRDLQSLTLDRGGALFGVTLDGTTDSVMNLTLGSPDHGLVPNTVAFVFSQKPVTEGGRYLGEFKVVSVGDGDQITKVQIAPNLPLTEAQSQRLAAATGPLTLYMTMPVDDAGLFAAMDDATRQSMLPEASVSDYAKADRKLHDYEQMFHENFVQRSLLTDAINRLNSSIARIETATQEAQKEAGYRQTEKASLATDLDKFQHESTVIAEYQDALSKMYAQVRDLLKATFLANHRMAAQLTASQLEAARRIDRQTDAAAAGVASPAPSP